jgi:DNA replication protein DnaC
MGFKFAEKKPVLETFENFKKDLVLTNEELKAYSQEWLNGRFKVRKWMKGKATMEDVSKELNEEYLKDKDDTSLTKAEWLTIQMRKEQYCDRQDEFDKELSEWSGKYSIARREYEKLHDIGIPYNLYKASSKDFKEGVVESLTQQHNLLIQGSSDTGKSHLTVALIKHICETRKDWDYKDFFIFYEEDFLRCDYEKSLEITKKLLNVDVLILDDLGSMGIGEHKRELIKSVIFERIRNSSSTWITTNSTIGEVYDQRTASKIIGEYTIVEKERTGTRLENKKVIKI